MTTAGSPAALHCPHHPEPGTVGEKLRQGGGGDHRGQHPGNHLRRICPQQRNCPSDEQIPGQPDGAERIGEQGQGQWLSVPADDRAAPYDPGRAEVHAQGSVHRDENRRLPHEGEAKAVFPVGDLLWRAVHGSGQGKPSCGLCRKEHLGKSHPGEVPAAEAGAAFRGGNPGGSAGSSAETSGKGNTVTPVCTAQTAGHQSPRQCARQAKNNPRKGERR